MVDHTHEAQQDDLSRRHCAFLESLRHGVHHHECEVRHEKEESRAMVFLHDAVEHSCEGRSRVRSTAKRQDISDSRSHSHSHTSEWGTGETRLMAYAGLKGIQLELGCVPASSFVVPSDPVRLP